MAKKSRKTRKPSKRKMMKARNECCPIIRVKCAPVKVAKWVKTTKFVNPHDKSDDRTKVVKERIFHEERRCSVKLGNRTVPGASSLAPGDAGHVVNKVKKGLLAKRCQGIVQSEK